MNNPGEKRVLIVGAGPTGQLMSLLLANHGVPSVLVDKRESLLTAPKAHAVNPRTLEICESIGVSASRLRALGASANDGGEVRFVGTLTGPEFGVLPYERQDKAACRDTPFPLSNIPQPVFEQELLGAVSRESLIEFSRGIEFVGLSQSEDHVDVQHRDLGSHQENTARFDYVIATDGAGSPVRRTLGIAMEGPESLEHFLMIHFNADLRALTEGRRGVLYFLFDPDVRGALIAYDHASTWVLMHPWDPASEQLTDYDAQRCESLIFRAVGQEVDAITVENVSPWSMSAQIAERYREGRVFLAGDSAHRFPPAGGLGLNTGAVDAQNLAWKIAAVLKGEAGESLLDTYEEERQPVARINSEQSLTNAAKIFDLIVAIHGNDPAETAQRYAAVAENPAGFPELSTAVDAQKPHFDSFNLQLGYRYSSAAIHNPVPAGETIEVSCYTPSWEAGAHFPHRWICVGDDVQPLQALLPANRFSLLCGPEASMPGADGINEIQFGRDFVDEADWHELTGLSSSGALLLRPDGHIAASFDNLNGTALEAVMSEILCVEH